MEKPQALRSLAALLTAHTLSQFGNVVTLFAVPFAVLAMGGDAIRVGVASFCATVPIVIGGPLGGVFVTRLGNRRASILADIVNGAALLLIPVLALTVGLPFWGLLALVFVGGLLDTPGQTARRVMVPELSAVAGVRLERSVGFVDAATRLSGLIGAPVAGILVAAFGPYPAIFVTVGAFAVSTIVTAAAVVEPPAVDTETCGNATASPGGYWSELAEGFGVVVRDPLLRLIIALVFVTNLLDAARSNTLLPLYAVRELGGSTALGFIAATFGAGALIGSVLFGFVAHRVPRRITFSICFTLAGGPSLLVFAFGAPLPVLLIGCAVSGLAAGALNPVLGAVEFERIAPAFRARVFGLMTALAWAGIPLGGLLGGVAATAWGLRATFGAVAVVYIVVCLTPMLGGRWRLMERGAIVAVSPGGPPAPSPAPAVPRRRTKK